MKNGLAIVGSLPPPYGGVSVHVFRLTERFKSARISFAIYQPRHKNEKKVPTPSFLRDSLRFVKSMHECEEDIIHLHINNSGALGVASAILAKRKKPYVITLHSERPIRILTRGWKGGAVAMRRSLERARAVICVSERIREGLQGCGVNTQKVAVIPAFLPPSQSELQDVNLPANVRRFLASHKTIIGSHGWYGYFLNNAHVYGFELLAKLAVECARRQGVGLYTTISGCYDDHHRREIYRIQKEWGLREQWLLVEEPFPSAAIYKHTDLFIRPTITDGDSVSIRECLYLGIPVLASDAVDRPSGCEVFPSRDFDTMNELIWQMIATRRKCDQGAQKGRDFGDEIIELLTSLT